MVFVRGVLACADILWAHRWFVAKTLRYKALIHLLGIDMSRACDTIDRSKLIEILKTIPNINSDEIRLIKVLLANTTLHVQFN